MYVVNCNGIREAVVQDIAPQCARPADIFKAVGCRPKCGQCLDDMRRHISVARAAPKPASTPTSKRRTTP